MKKVLIESAMLNTWLENNGIDPKKDMRVDPVTEILVPKTFIDDHRHERYIVDIILQKAPTTILTLLGFGLYNEECGLFLFPYPWRSVLYHGLSCFETDLTPHVIGFESRLTKNKHGLLDYGLLRGTI